MFIEYSENFFEAVGDRLTLIGWSLKSRIFKPLRRSCAKVANSPRGCSGGDDGGGGSSRVIARHADVNGVDVTTHRWRQKKVMDQLDRESTGRPTVNIRFRETPDTTGAFRKNLRDSGHFR